MQETTSFTTFVGLAYFRNTWFVFLGPGTKEPNGMLYDKNLVRCVSHWDCRNTFQGYWRIMSCEALSFLFIVLFFSSPPPLAYVNKPKIPVTSEDVGSKDSIVDIATGYGLDDQGVGVQVPVGSRIFSSPCRPDRLWGPPSLLSNGYQGVNWQGHEADHSPPTNAEVKKMWAYTSTPPYAFMA
jgi:hypothetical protein